MSVKTAGVGHFAIPTAPAAGASVTSGSANVFTTTYVALIASTSAALYITGIFVEAAAALGGTYDVVQLATGGAGSETVVGQYLIALSTGSTTATGYRSIFPPIPVANATRIAAKTADSVGSKATLITLECIAQSNVVDDGITVGTVTTVTAVTGLTASNLDATISSRMATYTQPTGFLAATFPAGTVANTTNITAGTITTATNLTNAPTAGDLTATMKTSVTTAATAATPTAAAVTGAVGSVTGAVGSVTGAVGSVTGAVGSVTGNVGGNVVGSVASVTAAVSVTGDLSATMKSSVTTAATAATPTAAAVTGAVGSVTGSVGSVVGLTASNLDAAVSSRLATSGYTAPDNTSVGAIKTKTDSLTFTSPGKLDVQVLVINGVTLAGAGTAANPMRPA